MNGASQIEGTAHTKAWRQRRAVEHDPVEHLGVCVLTHMCVCDAAGGWVVRDYSSKMGSSQKALKPAQGFTREQGLSTIESF